MSNDSLENSLTTPLLAYFGHHKCGSSWICRVLDDVCGVAGLKTAHHHFDDCFNGDVLALRAQSSFDFWRYTNADVNFVRYVNVRGFHVVRDPRDVIVSGYFSHLYSHSEEVWPRLRFYRRYLKSLSKREGLLAEMEFSAFFLAHMQMWDYSRPDILEVRFEQLFQNDQLEFELILRFLGVMPTLISTEQLREILERHSFQALTGGRPPGVEDEKSHWRNGKAGNWRLHFEPCHIDFFKKMYNPLLLKLGYEVAENWS